MAWRTDNLAVLKIAELSPLANELGRLVQAGIPQIQRGPGFGAAPGERAKSATATMRALFTSNATGRRIMEAGIEVLGLGGSRRCADAGALQAGAGRRAVHYHLLSWTAGGRCTAAVIFVPESDLPQFADSQVRRACSGRPGAVLGPEPGQ